MFIVPSVYGHPLEELLPRHRSREKLPAGSALFNTWQSRRHIDEVYRPCADTLKTRTTADWVALLDAADIPVMPLNDIESLLDDPHLNESGFFRFVDWSDRRAAARRRKCRVLVMVWLIAIDSHSCSTTSANTLQNCCEKLDYRTVRSTSINRRTTKSAG